MLGAAGLVFQPWHSVLLRLGFPSAQALNVLRHLHLHAVHAAISIVRLRRRLEHAEQADNVPDPP